MTLNLYIRRFSLAFAACLVISPGLGCVAEDAVPGPPYNIMALDRVEGGEVDGRSTFALQRRTLETVTSFPRLESPLFRVRQGGTLSVEVEIDGDKVTSGRLEGGRDPDLRYVVTDGTAVPRDDTTLSMFSGAYQFEYVFPRMLAATSPEVAAAFAALAPMDVFFGPQRVVTVVGTKTTARVQTNAFFNPMGWQFGIERPSAVERVTLAADGRVIAHELGHGVFQIVFFGGTDQCDRAAAATQAAAPWFPGRLSVEAPISGFNEGFADWISLAVTGGTNPLENANRPLIDGVDVNGVRMLVVDNFRWSQIDKLERTPEDVRCFDHYCVGTLFTRSLVATYLAQGHALTDEEARHAFSQTVVAALRGTAARMQVIGLPLPTSEVAHCEQRPAISARLDPPLIGAFLQAFLQGLAPEQSAILCDQLAQRFEEGFPVTFRAGCTP